jgi:hypothetical protein
MVRKPAIVAILSEVKPASANPLKSIRSGREDLMKKLMTLLAMCVMTTLVGWAPVQAATVSEPSARIHPTTSKITRVDVFGDGTLERVVYVSVTVKNCPQGTYSMDMELYQDGVNIPIATTANGAGIVGCDGSSPTEFNLGFTSDKLHPGRATADFDLQPLCDTGDCSTPPPFLVKVERVVHVPARHRHHHRHHHHHHRHHHAS